MPHIDSIVEVSACVDVNNGSGHIHGLMREFFLNKKGQKEKIFISFFKTKHFPPPQHSFLNFGLPQITLKK